MRWINSFFILAVLSGCGSPSSDTPSPLYEIQARDDGIKSDRPLTYRAKVPKEWVLRTQDLPSISNTMQPICEWSVEESGYGKIKIVIHNFPTENAEQRIPPAAQIARWKKQLNQPELHTTNTTPQSFGGFSGLLFEGTGKLNGTEELTTVMGWAMSLASEHYSTLTYRLNFAKTAEEINILRQMRADYTIKATGPKHLMQKRRQEIIAFARSFELISEI